MDYILLRLRNQQTGIETVEGLPKFVSMGTNKVCLRLVTSRVDGRKFYYRDGGAWECDFFMQGGKMISESDVSSAVNGIVLTPCTEEEWLESNRGYIPNEY